jgi:hypothetical protein
MSSMCPILADDSDISFTIASIVKLWGKFSRTGITNLNAPAAEQPWAYTIAGHAVLPELCYEVAFHDLRLLEYLDDVV